MAKEFMATFTAWPRCFRDGFGGWRIGRTRRPVSSGAVMALAMAILPGPSAVAAAPKAKARVSTAAAVSSVASTASAASSKGKEFKINYLSKDFVYLKAGRKDGLDNGDTLAIRRKDNLVALVVVEYAADYSSSCRFAKQKGNVVLGDVAVLQAKAAGDAGDGAGKASGPGTDTLVSRVRELPRVHVQGDVGKAFARIRGNIAYQVYLEQGYASEKVDLTRQNARVNLRMSEMPGHYSMQVDMYATQRNNLFSGASGDGNWDRRVNQFSFGYDDPRAKVTYEIGRIMPERISSIGYIDGGVATLRAGESQYVGVFGGNIPRMLYYESPLSVQKYGAFYGVDFRAGKQARFENTLGFGGEYDGAVISREFVNLRNVMSLPGNVSLSQVSEIDVNRGWRREKAGSSVSLSSMYVNGNWRATKILSFGVQYDTRKNYYRLNTRTLADSLFDDATRMGLRENMYLRFLPSASLYLGLGHSRLDGKEGWPYNYNVGLSIDNFIFKRMYVNTYFTGFESDLNGGYNGSLYLRKSFLNGNDLSFGYGRYRYEYSSGQASTIQSDWVRFGGTLQLVFKTYVAADYEYGWSGTGGGSGHRGFAELGYWL